MASNYWQFIMLVLEESGMRKFPAFAGVLLSLIEEQKKQPSFEQQPLAGEILGVPCNAVLGSFHPLSSPSL